MYEHEPAALAAQLGAHGLECVLFNMPAGDWAGGERGIGALAGREAEFDASIATTARYARVLNCPRVHCLSGLAAPSAATDATYRASLARALEALAPAGVDVLIEPINRRSIPGFYLSSYAQAAAIIGAVGETLGGRASPRLLFDLFHCQLIQGDVANALREHAALIGHVQLAGAPHRHEPDADNELNFPFLFRVLRRELSYEGFVGCEYNPRRGTAEGLGWLEHAGLEPG
jgi:hydroxypyruvate isomerase